ncbi:beta-glucanase (GH16 family) [Mucilaginibacter sp. UYNi724]
MLYKKCIYFAAITAVVAIAASCSSVKQAQVAGSAKGNVIFFDDFSESKIDRNKWSPIVTGFHTNGELQAYVDSSATAYIENGVLVLKPQYSPNFKTFDNQQFDFISGRYVTKGKFDFTYGTAEARIKVTAGDGLWPAWWMLGNGMWPNDGEIDIMEFIGEADWVSAAVHGPGYSGETPFVNRQYFDKENDATQWHVYGVEWTPDALVFKYDGKPMFRVTRTMAQHYGKWVFDNKQHLILNFAVGGIYPFKINGIKKPYYGLSESSLKKIKNGEAKMWVDWVKVTQNK